MLGELCGEGAVDVAENSFREGETELLPSELGGLEGTM